LALLDGLIELSASQCHPKVLARLTSAAEAIEQKMGRRRRAAARTGKVSDGPSAAAIFPVNAPSAQDVGGELAGPAHESERPTPILVTPPTDSHFGSEPEPGEQYGKRNEEQRSDGEEGGRNPMGRQEPGSSHVASELFGERSLPIGPHERPVSPLPDPLAPRRRSRRGGVIIVAAVTALVGIALYLLVTYDGNLIRHSLSTITSAVTSPIDAFLANASTSKTPTASVPNGSSYKAATGAPAMRTVGRTAADAMEKSPPQVQSQFLSPEEARYAKARLDQLMADATRILASRGPKAGTPLLDLKTHDGAAAVQTKLKALGYYHYTVDGIWGPMSVAALSTFRQEKGLNSDGVWDVAAQSALLGN
jgi:Putative peptidoglycan binding domain